MVKVQSYKRNFEEVTELIGYSLANHQNYELVENINQKLYKYIGLR